MNVSVLAFLAAWGGDPYFTERGSFELRRAEEITFLERRIAEMRKELVAVEAGIGAAGQTERQMDERRSTVKSLKLRIHVRLLDLEWWQNERFDQHVYGKLK